MTRDSDKSARVLSKEDVIHCCASLRGNVPPRERLECADKLELGFTALRTKLETAEAVAEGWKNAHDARVSERKHRSDKYRDLEKTVRAYRVAPVDAHGTKAIARIDMFAALDALDKEKE